jgi:tRNA (guanosine-2'-O-)-methyltransferase
MKAHNQHYLKQHGAEHVIKSLEPFILPPRQQRIHDVLDRRLNSIQLAIESPLDINNALATVRSSECLGLSRVHIISPEPDIGGIHLITQGAFYWINILLYDTLDDFLSVMRKEGRLLAGATVNATTPLSTVPIEQPLCLILGNEQTGLSAAAQAACDFCYSIPMTGMSESLNLSVAAAISLYDTTQRKRHHLNANGDLPPTEHQYLKASYYLNSVNQRLIDQTFKRSR